MRSGRILLASLLTLAFAFGVRAQSMSVDSLDGPVTTNEVNSFVAYIQTLNPVVWPDTGSMENEYAQGHSGENIKAMGLMYEISGNTDILNRMIYFCDTLLSQRNDLLAPPNGQRVYWNGKISPAWPGQALGTAPVYSTSASGDCVGHLANCARLILQTPALWSVTVPDGNPFGFGVTYLDRAKTYVAQADFTFSNCFFPDMLTLTNPGLTNIYCYPTGYPYQPGNQYPWNQAMMMSYPLQNLAIAHSLLGDNPTLAARYDSLVQANVGRFFTDPSVSQLRTDAAGNLAYDWAYNPSANGGEDSNHGSLDVAGFYRAYATGRYGITPSQMKPFANTIVDIMTLTIGSYYAGTVEGCTTCTGHAATTTYLRSGYFLTAEFRPDQYYAMVQGLHISAPGTTTSTDAFSRLMWIKNTRYQAANAFYVSASPASANPVAGSAATYTVKVTPSATFNGTVALSVDGLPAGTSATFSPATLTTSGTSTLTITTSLSTKPGTYQLTISGTSGAATQTAQVALAVGSPQVVAPTFSPAAGTYSSAQTVAISTTTAGATIRYTTDGSTPSATSGTIYTGPVTVAATTTLQAIAYAPGMFDSTVASAAYTIQKVAQLPLSAASVTASTYTSSYVPANTVDGNLGTRWAGKGDGVWIRYDLGAVNTVNYVNIAWYQGTTRAYTFDLQVSNDAAIWTTLLNRQTTSKTTNGFETYNFSPVNARYIRVVGHMNTSDTYTNITEFQVWGAAPYSTTSVTSNPSVVYTPAEQTVSVAASVTPSAGTLNSGTVTFTVLDGTEPVGTPVDATVTNNTATATYTLPAGQHAGTYTIEAVFGGSTPFAGSSATDGTLTIAPATATISISTYSVTYDGAPHTATGSATGVAGESLAGLDLSGTTHTNAGSYEDTWTFTDPTGNYSAASGTVTDAITPAPATIRFAPLAQWYDGTARTVTATTTPANLGVTITYNGGATAPTLPGDYAVVATVTDPNYAGTVTNTLSVAITALVRHGLTLSGNIDGSAQVLLGEPSVLNGASGISGDLLVPGTPSLQVNGRATYAGTKDNGGTVVTDPYTVTLNGNSLLRYLVRGVDPLALPTVATPPSPAGSRDVVLNSPGSIGDPTTLRNLTLNGKAGSVAVPPGTYGTLTANGTSGFILGIAGATTPAVYNLQTLTLNSNAQLQVVGPVIVVLANGITLNADAGNSAQPAWLTLQIANGGLTLNHGSVYASVVAPNGTVSLNGNATLTGSVTSDRLVINGTAALIQSAP